MAWFRHVPGTNLYLSSVTFGELQAGVEMTRERDPHKADDIQAWLEQVNRDYRVLPMQTPEFRVWARLMHRRPDHLIEDAMIAATAVVHGLVVATRNVRDFQLLGVPILNPFEFGRNGNPI